MPSDIYRTRKIVIMGSRGAGKSSLVFRFTEPGLFSEAYYPTISSTFQATIAHEAEDYECHILDTAGQDEFSILNSQHVIGIHGFIIVYSVTSRASFDNAKLIWDKIVGFCGRSVPAVLVAQKADLPRREVTEAQGKAMAQQMQCAFVEASAKEDVNITKVFELCLEEIQKRYGRRRYSDPQPSPKPKSPGGGCVIA